MLWYQQSLPAVSSDTAGGQNCTLALAAVQAPAAFAVMLPVRLDTIMPARCIGSSIRAYNLSCEYYSSSCNMCAACELRILLEGRGWQLHGPVRLLCFV
jgi:hypothetical protein